MDSRKLFDALSRHEKHQLLKNFSDEDVLAELARRQAEAAPAVGQTAAAEVQQPTGPDLRTDAEGGPVSADS